MSKLRRILIANRGEIAIRVMRTCKDLGIETVAVFSEADRLAAHVLYADYAVPIGPALAKESYLRIDKIVDACKQTQADAVHPGYGFLSENEDFVEACEKAKITFIGPPAEAMRTMGSKTQARIAMQKAGVPVVPGDNGQNGEGFPDAKAALAAANAIGFPVLIKASAGGGGKGMRFCDKKDGFEKSFDAARREAENAFGDGTVYIEKAIVKPRHVEIQVFADNHKNAVHLGERDCSIQRRHQKVIEESPSPAVDEALRQAMGTCAVKAAKACDYRGAGTIEFLLGADKTFYFLEMNTRLQVEHPITEMVYGVDLVAWQIRVAEGEKLPLSQQEIDARHRGAAIECRIYAEDPVKFMPSPGTIQLLRTPAGPYVRDDSAAYSGAEISAYYDPLISKLVTWGDDREQALARMRRALSEYAVTGIETNLAFHRAMLSHPAFVKGDYDTGLIEREPPKNATAPPGSVDAALITAAISQSQNAPLNEGPKPTSEPSAWRRAIQTEGSR